MASSSLLLLVSVISFISHFHGVDSTGGTTDAVCLSGSQYAWTENAQNQSPCLLAANAIAPCQGSGGWNVPALADGVHYDPPTPSKATRCYCSWAVYNLLGACAACQGLAGSIQSWVYYRQNCQAMNGSLYPPGLLSEFSIPHYAIRNPLNWTAEIFNVSEAISDQSQGHPDVDVANLPASSTSSTGSTSASTGSPTVTVPAQTGGVPVGVIAGGTVVGVVAVCLVAALVTWFLCRRRTHTLEEERHSLLRRRSKRPEENIDPYIYESPMPSRSPSLLPRDKYSSGCATVATTRSTSASTLQVPSANDRPVTHVPSRLNHSESSTSTVAAAPNHGQIPVEAELEAPMPTVNSALPVTQTSPPPYRHTPEMTPVSVQYLSSPEAAASLRGDNPHPSHWQNMDPAFSTWNSLSGRESDIVFATMTSSNLPVSPFSSIRPAVRFGTRVEGGVDDHEGSGGIISRIA